MSSYAPEPSPAPTLAGVPGYFPPTPDLASSSSAHPDPLASASVPEESEDTESYAHKVNNAVGIAVGAVTGLLVGGPVGGILGGGIVSVAELENDGLKDKVADHPDEGTREGAAVEEKELDDDRSLTPTVTRNEPETTQETSAVVPDFGTPAIEKEQAELARSPAQRLLGERSESTVGAENILLAGGTGAVVADREVEEPQLESESESTESGASEDVMPPRSDAEDDEISPITRSAPVASRPVVNTQESTSSFAAAVLAAGTGIDTPTREDVPLSMSGSTGVHPLVRASDETLDDSASIATARPETVDSQLDQTPRSHPNILPVFVPTQATAPVSSERDIVPDTQESTIVPLQDSSVSSPEDGIHNEEVVHNPPPQTLAAIVPASEIEQPEAERPQDFEPYTPPAVTEESAPIVETEAVPRELATESTLDETSPSSESRRVPYDFDSIDNQRAIPPQQAQSEPVLVMPSVDKGKGRAIEPEELAAVPATTPEQAGFAPGAPTTVATEEFAHLSQPAPQAELAAQEQVPESTVSGVDPELERRDGASAAPLVFAMAGPAAAAAAPLAVNNNATSAHLSNAPLQQIAPIQQVAPVQQVTPAPQAASAPRSLFTETTRPMEQEQARPSNINAVPTPVPVQSQPQPQAQRVSPVAISPVQQTPVGVPRTSSPHGLAEGVERSPHMKIQTHQDDTGHKKLHRKSLAADRKPLTFGVGVTKASKPDPQRTIENETRRDRFMDGWSGVPDPTMQRQQPIPQQQQYVVHQRMPVQQQMPVQQHMPVPQQQPAVHYVQQPAVAQRGLVAQSNFAAPPVGAVPRSQVPLQQAPSSPHSPTGTASPVHRKLSKSRPRRKSNASGTGSESGGFLDRVFGRHPRSASGSVDGGSARGSLEMQRPNAAS